MRVLGSSMRAEVHLGHSRVAKGPELRTAAIKVYRPTTTLHSIDAEIEALARASSPHLLRLEDLATGPDGRPVLVLALLQSASAAQLLLNRGEISAGEAVTLLAPLAEAVAELHRVGVAHGRLRLGSISFDFRGAPVIRGFGDATLVGPMPTEEHASSLTPAQLSDAPAIRRDVSDLTAIVRTVLESTPPSRSANEFLEWMREAERADGPDRYPHDLRDRLFDLASPEPISFEARRPTLPAGSRTVPGGRATRSARMVRHQGFEVRRGSAWLSALPLPEWIADRITESMPAPAAVANSIRTFLAPVRKPVWLAAGAVAVSLLLSLLLLPSDRVATDPEGERRPAAPDRLLPTAKTGGAQHPEEGRAPPYSDSSAGIAAISGDDPVEAAVALLARRSVCIADRSVICLDRSHQQGSAAWDADGHLIRRMQEGKTSDDAALPDGRPSLVERMGNSALLALGLGPTESAATATGAKDVDISVPPPVTMLLVKGEDGWRIRDLIVGGSP